MIPNNNQRYAIWQTLANRFDYNEMTAACAREGVPTMGAHEFSHKVGMIMCGKAMFPDLDDISAYSAFAALYFNQPVVPQPMPTPEDLRRMFPQNYDENGVYRNIAPTETGTCGTCGGGQIR